MRTPESRAPFRPAPANLSAENVSISHCGVMPLCSAEPENRPTFTSRSGGSTKYQEVFVTGSFRTPKPMEAVQPSAQLGNITELFCHTTSCRSDSWVVSKCPRRLASFPARQSYQVESYVYLRFMSSPETG